MSTPTPDTSPVEPLAVDATCTGDEAVTVIDGDPRSGLLLLCDHAGNELPPAYASLGLPPCQLARHIAYDIGAAEVTLGLARRLAAPAVISRYSRLLIDLNRGLDDPTLVMRISDGAVVPGNRQLPAAERQHRIDRYWRPYHDAVACRLDAMTQAAGRGPAVVSIHSFTEVWKGAPRPWHAAVLWHEDARLAGPLLRALRAEADLCVGDNEPYAGGMAGDTLWRHARPRALPSVLIEIRQDLIRGAAGQAQWIERLAGMLETCLASP